MKIQAAIAAIDIELAVVRQQTKKLSKQEWRLARQIIDLVEEQTHLLREISND